MFGVDVYFGIKDKFLKKFEDKDQSFIFLYDN